MGQQMHNEFSGKHENTCTLKSMKIPTLWKYFWSLTVHPSTKSIHSKAHKFMIMETKRPPLAFYMAEMSVAEMSVAEISYI